MNYDDWKLASPPYYDVPPVEEDEGIQALRAAIAHLLPRSTADLHSEEGYGPDAEAEDIMLGLILTIQNEYECQQCGKALSHRGGWCSARCRAAYDL